MAVTYNQGINSRVLTLAIAVLLAAGVLSAVIVTSMNTALLTVKPGRWRHYVGGGRYEGCNPILVEEGQLIFSTPATGEGDLWIAQLPGERRAQLTNSPEYEGHASLTLANDQILFVREVGGRSTIWIMDVSGQHQRQLTDGASYDSQPVDLGMGDVAFVRGLGRNSRIHVLNLNTLRIRRLTSSSLPERDPAKAGSELILYRQGRDQIIELNRTTGAITSLNNGYLPKYIPDYNAYAFIRERSVESYQYEIWTAPIRIGGVGIASRITRSGGYKSALTCVDGSKLMYLQEPEARGVGVVTLLDPVSGVETPVMSIKAR